MPSELVQDTDMTPTVAAIGQMHFEGNIIPHTWYKAITFGNGKTHLNAIVILAEIVYWYRPTITRDEASGAVISVRKKFAADKYQRHYQSFADQFGLTKRQCQDAIARLIELGFITRELRTVDTPQGKVSNVPFFEPVVETLQRYSYHVITGQPPRSNGIALAPHGETYTKNTSTKKPSKKKSAPPTQGRGNSGQHRAAPPKASQDEKKDYLPDNMRGIIRGYGDDTESP